MKNWCGIKDDLVRIATDEEALWTDANGNKIRENDPAMLGELERYWTAVPQIGDPHNMAIRSANDREAWSAAFICSVFRDAGVDLADGFRFRRRHLAFIVEAIRNRENSDQAKTFWLYDKTELFLEASPQRGDLICYNRFDDQGNYSNHSYESLRNRFAGNSTEPTGVSHTNLVVSVSDVNGNSIIKTAGGNLDGSVRFVFHWIDQGRVMQTDEFGNNATEDADVFAIIKNLECP